MRIALLLSVLIFISVSCEQPKNIVSSSTGFVSNPQVIEKQEIKTLEIGQQAPDFLLPATDGKLYSLADFDDFDVLAIIFTCNHCPTAQAYETRLKQVVENYKDQSVKLIAISPNSPLGILYEELGYSDIGDSYEDGQHRHETADFNFVYLYDGDDHGASLKYGPVATPHAFVFDKNRLLQYVGRIDANEKPGTGQAEDLKAAINALLANETVALAQTKTFGCSTKWAWKESWARDKEEEWKRQAVTLQDLDKAGVQQLIANDSDKLRLINVWATWCAPCRLEYPEFVILHRMFGARDFEFISLSVDDVKKRDKLLDFLKETNSSLPNYVYSAEDKYEMIEAVDEQWNGALSYTLLIEPGGNVIWNHQGTVDFQELKTVIVDHEMIGRVY